MATSPTAANKGGFIEPRGPRPRRIEADRVGIYAFLAVAALFFMVPLWVMFVTSFKTLPEIREGMIFNWPRTFTLDPWFKAWDSACTGRDCEGLKPGFWNSVRITAVSVPISIVVSMINGYALSFWRYKGSAKCQGKFNITRNGPHVVWRSSHYAMVQ